jgi:hypothetical protein
MQSAELSASRSDGNDRRSDPPTTKIFALRRRSSIEDRRSIWQSIPEIMRDIYAYRSFSHGKNEPGTPRMDHRGRLPSLASTVRAAGQLSPGRRRRLDAYRITGTLYSMPPAGALRLGDGRSPREVGQWLGRRPGHSLCHRPRQSQADQALRVEVVLPVGSSSLPAPSRTTSRW